VTPAAAFAAGHISIAQRLKFANIWTRRSGPAQAPLALGAGHGIKFFGTRDDLL